MKYPVIGVVFAAVALAAPAKQLKIERAALHQMEDGPPLAPNAEYIAGETVFFSCQISNYEIAGEEEDRRVLLDWRIEVTDPAGIPVVEPNTSKMAAKVRPEDKEWLPKIRYNFAIPSFAPTGNYRLTFAVKDETSGSEAKTEMVIRIRGQNVATSDSLAVRSLRFYRGEDDPSPLAAVVYRPGDTLWARFVITGFKLGEKNRYDVAYGLAVLRENGEKMFEQPEAAQENGESFYPRRYVLGGLSLNLTKDLARGTYILMVTLHDKVGGTNAETREAFRVE
jgi:hypothetical protein